MELFEWQKQKALKNTEAAKLLNVSDSMLSHYYAGRRGFSVKKAVEIQRITDGAVPAYSLLNIPDTENKASNNGPC